MSDSSNTAPDAPSPTTDENPTFEAWYSALENSHQKLSEIVSGLTPEEIESPSYDSEWSIAQVLSHLGSGAEIFTLFLHAGLIGDPGPGRDEFQPLWDRWNAKSPAEQAHDALHANATLLEQVGALDEAQQREWHMSMNGQDRDLSGLLRLRLAEHAVHTWDVAVVRDDSATIAPDVVTLLIDVIDWTVGRTGKPSEETLDVRVATQAPKRAFLLRLDNNGADLQPIAGSSYEPGAQLELSAEAFIRLIYGRLDPAHTPEISARGIDLDHLRQVFPGF